MQAKTSNTQSQVQSQISINNQYYLITNHETVTTIVRL